MAFSDPPPHLTGQQCVKIVKNGPEKIGTFYIVKR